MVMLQFARNPLVPAKNGPVKVNLLHQKFRIDYTFRAIVDPGARRKRAVFLSRAAETLFPPDLGMDY